MPIVQQGALNTTALVVPDLYVVIVPPSVLNLNGVPTNKIGMVGTASWGPVNVPTQFGSAAGYAAVFGPVINRAFDMGTHVATAVQQGAQNFLGVRVTDGTDTHASVEDNTTTPDITFTAKYTGSLGNGITVQLAPGTSSSLWNVTVALAGYNPDLFIGISGTGAAFWSNLASAINNGQSAAFRGPSQLITATAGSGTAAPTSATYSLTGGTDGTTTITSSVLIGSNSVSPNTGMYALANQGVSIGDLCDATDTTTWSVIEQFGLANGIYFVNAFPAGSTVAADVTAKQTAGIDQYSMKVMHGDWIWWRDQTNDITRLVSPQGFVAGLLGNLSPNESTLNKGLYAVIGSQKSGAPGSPQQATYSTADLTSLFENGIDVITNPVPGGAYWGVRGGFNASAGTGQGEGDDSYTRMTNYLASTLEAGMGCYVGRNITLSLLANITATLLNFMQNLMAQNVLALGIDGSLPFSVVCNSTNNSQTSTGQGNVVAAVQVRYTAINKKFIVNMQGGQTVTVSQAIVPQNSQLA